MQTTGLFVRLSPAIAIISLLVAIQAIAAEPLSVVLRVHSLDLANPLQPTITATVVDNLSSHIFPPGPIKVHVHFIVTPQGCLDLGNKGNHDKMALFSLQVGQLLTAQLDREEETYFIRKICGFYPERAAMFTGWEKISDPALLDPFINTTKTGDVIVTLQSPSDEEQNKLPQQITAMQDAVLSHVGNTDFQLISRLSNTPVLFGRVNYSGLKCLAAHPFVRTIEQNMNLDLHHATIEGE